MIYLICMMFNGDSNKLYHVDTNITFDIPLKDSL